MDEKTQNSFLLKEHQKPAVGNFTLAEYTEKVIMYGFLMVSLLVKAGVKVAVKGRVDDKKTQNSLLLKEHSVGNFTLAEYTE